MWRDIFVTIIQLIVASPSAWKEIDKEDKSQNDFVGRFLHPVIGIIALAAFIGGMWFTRDGGLQGALKSAIINVVSIYGGFYISSYAINEAAPRFGLSKNLARFQKFTGYSSVVVFALYMIVPFLSDFFILWLLVLYTLYVVQTGALFFLNVSAGKRLNFTLLASALIILAPAVIRGLFSFLIK
ncbi:YIP1 family protein [Proteiniphilum sp. UBA1028]|jgi:hypothetical protein|uniref:YIP1 family protein n=1 Tax=Proteiniphilum sp. UBA1028 TaxID=1947251 RepID=UPI000E9602F9|nr:YIP1 family protein [Proteiniphilum sp. UBA1028]HBG58198.1 hypothetical protein [Porphyromonadaceae bacterium]